MTIVELIRRLTRDLEEKSQTAFVDLHRRKEGRTVGVDSADEVTERIAYDDDSFSATFPKSCR